MYTTEKTQSHIQIDKSVLAGVHLFEKVSMSIGNFFGMLPDSMASSRLYGVELDSITGRIAQKLYPQADITVAGFETTDRRDFYDLAVGNVPFGQYKVNDKAYNKLGFSIHNYFFAKTIDQIRPGGVIAS